MDLSIVIPAYNESDSLKSNLPKWINASNANGWHIILVDDGSSDQTREVLAGFPKYESVTIIRHKVNRGYGGALKSGILSADTKYVITLDADGQHDILSIDKLVARQEQTDADLVIGARVKSGNSSPFRSMGKAVIRWISRILIPNQLADLNSGMKLFRTELAKKYLTLCPNTMAFSDVITLAFLVNSHLVVETPINVHPRVSGKSKININTAFDTLIEIINIVVLFNPLRIFLPLSLVLFIAGLGWGIRFIILGRGVSVGSLLALVSGGLCLLLGLLAEQLSKIRLSLIEKRSSEK